MRRFIIFTLIIICCSNQLFSQFSNNVKKTHSDSLLEELYSGNDDIQIILDLYQNDIDLSVDSLYKLLDVSDSNYLNNDTNRRINPDLQFRDIIFSDQVFRIQCYIHKTIDYSVVQKNDSTLQVQFLQILKEQKDLNVLQSTIFQMTFDLLLIHSVATLHTGFFVNNFNRYSSGFSNDFKSFGNLKGLVDIYLKFKYKKQYFGTEWGRGKLENGTFGLLPKMTDNEFNKILLALKIEDAIF